MTCFRCFVDQYLECNLFEGTYFYSGSCLTFPSPCTVCDSAEVCTSCVGNVSVKGNTCECDQGYFSQNGFCERQLFYASLTAAEDNTLTFSETPTSQLAPTDYNIYLQNKSIDFSYSKKQGDDYKFEFSLLKV
eukprot:CAMPEP_0202439366 /NCGR_PEP_ID=MMETSP1345-20130828/36125_1 /ASSEMBLY_ACC=CAM_ASM_000843 /TAXON_ID=342563 /ORGANISM="Fabrea Fabrea salina" /LENGTH=132 /DNA_ID=CAMNT_0049053893 /DNA_START=420 /DNA_END=818 /DNA_ORIENTATION=-